jgi:hypothetical protein
MASMNDRHLQLRVGDCIRILAVPGQGVPGFWMHDDTRRLFERLVADRAVLQIYEIDDSGLPWVKCPCPTDSEEGGTDYLAIDGFDVWEIVTSASSSPDGADQQRDP